MKKLSDLVDTTFNNNVSTKQSQMVGKESLSQRLTGANQSQETSSTGVLTVGTIHKLFAKLQARYGNQWTNQWDDDRIYKMAVHEWYEELKHLVPNDLRKGLDNYRGDYPPNMIQFYNACTQKPIGKPAPYYAMFKSEPDRRALEFKGDFGVVSKERGDKWLDRIRKGDLIPPDE